MIDYSKIALLSTVANFELYKKTAALFPKGIQKYVINGTNGMHGIHSIRYMMKKLGGKGIEWLIMADEDVVFVDSEAVFSIIEQMEAHKITVSGVRDGGMVAHRNQNPYLINTFFSILNFKEVEQIWNAKEMLKNQYLISNEFNDDLNTLVYDYNSNSIYEPYYCFYLWLRRNQKTFLFFDAKMDEDGITNAVLFQNEVFLYHTWYARSYGINEKHTKRIDVILQKITNADSEVNFDLTKVIFYKKATFAVQKKLSKLYKNIRAKFLK